MGKFSALDQQNLRWRIMGKASLFWGTADDSDPLQADGRLVL